MPSLPRRNLQPAQGLPPAQLGAVILTRMDETGTSRSLMIDGVWYGLVDTHAGRRASARSKGVVRTFPPRLVKIVNVVPLVLEFRRDSYTQCICFSGRSFPDHADADQSCWDRALLGTLPFREGHSVTEHLVTKFWSSWSPWVATADNLRSPDPWIYGRIQAQ